MIYYVPSIQKLLLKYGINFNNQDEKVSWLPLELFADSEYDEVPNHTVAKEIPEAGTKNIQGFLEGEVIQFVRN